MLRMKGQDMNTKRQRTMMRNYRGWGLKKFLEKVA